MEQTKQLEASYIDPSILTDAELLVSKKVETFTRILDNGLRIFRPGNFRGDRFYDRLRHKRVNGKWRVKV